MTESVIYHLEKYSEYSHEATAVYDFDFYNKLFYIKLFWPTMNIPILAMGTTFCSKKC